MKLSNSATFKCRCCGACCRIKNGIVRVSDNEIRKISDYLGVSENEFIAEHTDIAPDRKGLILKSREDGSCFYLDENNRCEIHEVKPRKCATFPFEWVNPDSSTVCPALNEFVLGDV